MGTQRFLRKIASIFAALAGLAIAQQAPNPPARNAQTVITMEGDYSITHAGPQDDGKHYKLNRLAKDGTVYETVDLTKINSSAGTTIYAGPNGTYTPDSNGTLQEQLDLRAPQPVVALAPDAPLTLMRNSL